jgi:WhiB family redox-sensing transcriptional regulator
MTDVPPPSQRPRREWISAGKVGGDRSVGEQGSDTLLALRFSRPPWMAEAECARQGLDVSTFFPKHGQTGEQAKGACAICPVRDECLDAALEWGPLTYGIWGGTTKPDRERTLRGEVA